MFPNWLTDLQIKFAPVPSTLDNVTARGVLWQAAPSRFLLHAPDVARYLVEDGHRLTIHRAPSADESDVMRLAQITPLAALLYQRGMFAFHAAVVAPLHSSLRGAFSATKQSPSIAEIASQSALAMTAEGAILLAGDSGAGKSTLLAALLQNGWQMLTDELAIVGLGEDGKPQVFPTHPEILLWNDAAKKLNVQNFQELNTLANSKRAFSASSHFVATPLPLRAMYWLSVRNEREIETEQIRGQKFFQAINTLLYNTHVADALLDRASHFRLASALTQTVSLRRLKRPRGQWSVEEIAEQLQKSQTQNLKFEV